MRVLSYSIMLVLLLHEVETSTDPLLDSFTNAFDNVFINGDPLKRHIIPCVDDTVCYDTPFDIGCFEQGPTTPYCPLVMLPDDPTSQMPQFLFNTPDTKLTQSIDAFDLETSINALQLDRNRKLFVLIHGFSFNTELGWMLNMRNKLVNKGFNVLITNWTLAAMGPNYFQASSNTRSVGRIVAHVVNMLAQRHQLSLDTDVTLVGFSLGAHVAGYAGAALQTLGRIIGLDPAGPLFGSLSPIARLDKSDALNVQIIHTSSWTVTAAGVGIRQAIGHIDFYVNNGQGQPMCSNSPLETFLQVFDFFDFSNFIKKAGCSHYIAVKVFMQLIDNYDTDDACKFIGTDCQDEDSWINGSCTFLTGQYDQHQCEPELVEFNVCPPASYYFATTTDDSNLCGNPWIIEMTVNQGLNGKAILTIFDNSSHQYPIAVSIHTYIQSDRIIRKNIALPKNIKSVQTIGVQHTPLVDLWIFSTPPIIYNMRLISETTNQSFSSNGQLTLPHDDGPLVVILLHPDYPETEIAPTVTDDLSESL